MRKKCRTVEAIVNIPVHYPGMHKHISASFSATFSHNNNITIAQKTGPFLFKQNFGKYCPILIIIIITIIMTLSLTFLQQL